MAKLWAGRFQKEEDERVNDFNSSISFDQRMFREDIAGSIAHAAMLGEQGIIQREEAEKLQEGLSAILDDLEDGALSIDPAAEDIHMFIEAELTRRLGDTGKRLHTARSRNDQVALDVRSYLKGQVDEISRLVEEFIRLLCKMAREHTETIMPGYTHLQRAQPVTFGHHLMAYAWMLLRDRARLSDCRGRMNILPLGSCALAGTTYPLNRERVAELLAFDGVTQNSLDGVSDRDFCIELASALSIMMMHLSRYSEEVILWCSWEFKFVELDDAYATGSSIMPQKKNPDVCELVRGKTGRVYGDLLTLLTMMKGLPLAYNKDMQEDKEAVFDAVDTVKLCLRTVTPMTATMTVQKENMRQAAAKGFINATDAADYLTKKGVPFRDAYKAVGQLVAVCTRLNRTLETLPIAEYQAVNPAFEGDVYDAINLERCVNERKIVGGPSAENVRLQAEQVEAALTERTKA